MENFLYFPPELLTNKNSITEIHSSALLWMLGVICFKLMFNKLPFADEQGNISREEFTKILLKGDYTVPLDKPVSYEFLMFVTTLLQFNPLKRENFDEIKMMPFLNEKPQKFNMVKRREGDDDNRNNQLKLSIYRNMELLVFIYKQIPDVEWNQNFEGPNNQSLFQDQSIIKKDITICSVDNSLYLND